MNFFQRWKLTKDIEKAENYLKMLNGMSLIEQSKIEHLRKQRQDLEPQEKIYCYIDKKIEDENKKYKISDIVIAIYYDGEYNVSAFIKQYFIYNINYPDFSRDDSLGTIFKNVFAENRIAVFDKDYRFCGKIHGKDGTCYCSNIRIEWNCPLKDILKSMNRNDLIEQGEISLIEINNVLQFILIKKELLNTKVKRFVK